MSLLTDNNFEQLSVEDRQKLPVLYTRLPLNDNVISLIQTIRDHFTLMKWTEAHITQLFVGKQKLTDIGFSKLQNILNSTFMERIYFSIKQIKLGDTDFYIFFELEFMDDIDRHVYMNMYKGTWDFFGDLVTMSLASRDNVPTIHVTIMTPNETRAIMAKYNMVDANEVITMINNIGLDYSKKIICSRLEVFQGSPTFEIIHL